MGEPIFGDLGLERISREGDPMIDFRLFLKLDAETRIGHGKISLLEAIEETGSISAAGRTLGMTYRRAWELVDHLNKAFGRPLVAGQTGGTGGGGARLTDLGREVVRSFRALEAATEAAAAPHIRSIAALMEGPAGEHERVAEPDHEA